MWFSTDGNNLAYLNEVQSATPVWLWPLWSVAAEAVLTHVTLCVVITHQGVRWLGTTDVSHAHCLDKE